MELSIKDFLIQKKWEQSDTEKDVILSNLNL